jgi:hypothetical protein
LNQLITNSLSHAAKLERFSATGNRQNESFWPLFILKIGDFAKKWLICGSVEG